MTTTHKLGGPSPFPAIPDFLDYAIAQGNPLLMADQNRINAAAKKSREA